MILFSDLYFIRNPETGLVKIGQSRDVLRRARQLSNACGAQCDIVRVVYNGAYFESWIHRAFAPNRRHGEWFEVTPALATIMEAATIASLAELYPRAMPTDPVRFGKRKGAKKRSHGSGTLARTTSGWRWQICINRKRHSFLFATPLRAEAERQARLKRHELLTA